MLAGFGPAFNLIACYCGDLTAGEKVLQPLLSATRPAAGEFRAVPYVEMQALGALQLEQLSFWRSGFFSDLERGALDVLGANMARPQPCGMFMIHLHGRLAKSIRPRPHSVIAARGSTSPHSINGPTPRRPASSSS
jgi:hypothetical protein